MKFYSCNSKDVLHLSNSLVTWDVYRRYVAGKYINQLHNYPTTRTVASFHDTAPKKVNDYSKKINWKKKFPKKEKTELYSIKLSLVLAKMNLRKKMRLPRKVLKETKTVLILETFSSFSFFFDTFSFRFIFYKLKISHRNVGWNLVGLPSYANIANKLY